MLHLFIGRRLYVRKRIYTSKPFVFCRPQLVIGEDVNPGKTIFLTELTDCMDILVGIRASGDNWAAETCLFGTGASDEAEILQDLLIGDSGHLYMFLIINNLDICQIQIDIWHDLFKAPGGYTQL